MKFLRLREVKTITGLSGTTIWRLEKFDAFPKRRLIARRAVAWLQEEVEQWIASKKSVELTNQKMETVC